MKNILKNKNILVYGLGKSGLASYELLKTMKANVVTFDDKRFPNKMLDLDIKKLDFAVVSPGIPQTSKLYQVLIENNVRIISEIELASMFTKGKKIAITGTNGKTTTITLLGHIFKTCVGKFKRKNIFVAGNVGIPLASIALKTNRKSTSIIELSSFQLEKIENFNADIVSILNIAADHLDRYKNVNEYIAAKERIFENQGKHQIAVLNYNDKNYKRFASKCKGKIYYFSTCDESQNENYKGIFKHEDRLFFKENSIEYLLSVKNIKLVGNKNIENVLAAVLIAKLEGLNMKKVERAINSFAPLENRLEVVLQEKNVTYINDSKATNIASAVADINAIDGDKIVLLGGSDKGENFEKLAKQLKNNKKIAKFIVFGATSSKIVDAFDKHNMKNYEQKDNFENAVNFAKDLAKKQNKKTTVLLAPACASFDEFENYIERGKAFKKIVILNNKKEIQWKG